MYLYPKYIHFFLFTDYQQQMFGLAPQNCRREMSKPEAHDYTITTEYHTQFVRHVIFIQNPNLEQTELLEFFP